MRIDAMLTTSKVAGEVTYLALSGSAKFERPYGSAWVPPLRCEAALREANWGAALKPLARIFAARLKE